MKSHRGVAPKGEDFYPEDLPEERDEATTASRAAPGPGLPISEEEYRKLKEDAEHPAPRRQKPAKKRRPKTK